MKRVLIAQQSTIPHYRVDFFNLLQANKPEAWEFEVVFDVSEPCRQQFFKEPVDMEYFRFPVQATHTYGLPLIGRFIHFQSFLKTINRYDLVIVGSGLSNLSYPLSKIFRRRGLAYALWGQGKDRFSPSTSLSKRGIEHLRIVLAKSSDGFFAYTEGTKTYLASKGVDRNKIQVINNTIDINKQRRLFHSYQPKRLQIRARMGLDEKRVLLFVGRFTRQKKVDFLLESFECLSKTDERYHLLLVGSGSERYQSQPRQGATFLGPIVDNHRLAEIYVASDIFAHPGCVGLGPIQAFCYDLPIVTIDSEVHSSEYEHLTPENAVILPRDTTPEQYAQAIQAMLSHASKLASMRQTTWSSMRHLTLDSMVNNFIVGVNSILASERRRR